MMQRVIRGMQRALGLHHPGRNLEVWPDDVFILSFPKSGNTWTRFLIANLVYSETPADFSNINRLTPDPESLSKRELARMPRPRIIKSHQYFDPRYKRVIYVVRDPRDVALSQFHFHRKRGLIEDGYPPEKFVARFAAGETSPYGSWGENVASWSSTKSTRQDVPFVRSAQAGGWRTGLPEGAVAQMETAWGNLMTHLGYELLSPARAITVTRTTNFDSGFAETMLNGPSR